MQLLFFEDFSTGQSLPGSEIAVSVTDAAWFAAEFHTLRDVRETGRNGPTSGWHVAALGMRLIYDSFLSRTASMGAPGIEDVEWPNPVFVGDRLRMAGRVATLRPSRSRPEMGLVGFEFILTNQRDECVMKQNNVILVQRRTKEACS